MKRNNDSGVSNVSQPLADIFSGLMLIFLLALMLVILYVSTKDGIGDYEEEPGENVSEGEGYAGLDHGIGDIDDNDDGNGDGSGGDELETDEIIEGEALAAIRVVVIDADTKKVIKEEGIDFNLYSDYSGEQVTLNTYYPEKVSYTEFSTAENGSFLLPEKVAVDTYILKNMTAPVGYISGGTYQFTIPEAYDWDDPYVVYYPLSMKYYSFAIQVTDEETGAAIPGGEYEVYTADGKSVGSIICDVNGYGQSGLLSPSSKYVIKQSQPNKFYSALEDPITVTLGGSAEQVIKIGLRKTTLELNLVDELEKTPIEGAAFELYTVSGELIRESKTDKSGSIKLQNLDKDTSYVMKQISWPENSNKQEYQIEFSIDAAGRINGKSVYSVKGTNRIIRIDITTEDKLLGFNIEGKALMLKGENGEIIYTWTSESVGTAIEGLSPGSYTVSEEGGGTPVEIIIEDTAEIQYFKYRILDNTTVILYVVGAIFAVTAFGALVALAVVIIVKKRKRRKEGEEYQ